MLENRSNRASAMAILMPFMSGVQVDSTAGVSFIQKWAVTWCYAGVSVGLPLVRWFYDIDDMDILKRIGDSNYLIRL